MSTIDILGYSYTLNLSQGLKEMDGNIGECDLDRHTIAIANDLGREIIDTTLLHEIIEALNYHLELNLTHPQIMALEVGFHQVLCGNGVSLDNLHMDKKG